ncbi:hypothetical protein A6E13_19635 [Aliivibrio fischeri]|uniref:hypothetical protein n=1 Tax=Aliivibrio fischeri TaxID=668 RepID=UPI00080E499D|nr:hypothetical protein [Aliivibrio fischeri]OCH29854.1 hypothetical protein A6E13_19635 [Aliivibrio fischeri]
MQSTDDKYVNNEIFTELKYYADFYEYLSDSVMCFPTSGTSAIMNIDTYVFMSIKGTIESINLVLKDGQLNDAYALLRKFYDSVLINSYVNLYINDHADKSVMYVQKINDWLKGKEALPRMGEMTKYLNNSSKLVELNKLIDADDRYKSIRKRCNDNMHYNYFSLLMMNEGKVYMKERYQHLLQLKQDIKDVFLLNIIYMFIINDYYMLSSDYVDYLEAGMTPPEDSQYWVAPFIQEMVDNFLKTERPDFFKLLSDSTSMHLS